MTVLEDFRDMCEEDDNLEEALGGAQLVTDGGGEPARVSDLFDPTVDELKGLLAPEAFPAPEFCTRAVRFRCMDVR